MSTTQQRADVELKRTAAQMMNTFIEKADAFDIDPIDTTDWETGEAGDYENIIEVHETLASFMQSRETWTERGTLENGEKYGISNVACVRKSRAGSGKQRVSLLLCEHENKVYVWEF